MNHLEDNEPIVLTSVDDEHPIEEGGPNARTGFNYQDEIAVSFFLQMLENTEIQKIHCETHDDIIVVRTCPKVGDVIAEFVQVKASEDNQLWSVAMLCQNKGKIGNSLFETSLARDRHTERSAFRIVTLRDVNNDLKLLTFDENAPGRSPDCDAFKRLEKELNQRCPKHSSKKKNTSSFWIQNCQWTVCHSEEAVKRENQIAVLRLASSANEDLLIEHADVILEELRIRAKDAGSAKWKTQREKKIVTRQELVSWWQDRLLEIKTGASVKSGGKLREKIREALLPDDIGDMAVELRQSYSEMSRTSKYMEAETSEHLRNLVRAELHTLRSKHVAGELALDGVGFHALCVDKLNSINASQTKDGEDRSAFLKGCMYDITDRCLLRFVRPT